MNALPSKPLPEIPELTRPFWSAAREGRLVMQKCSSCGTVNFHPKPWCIECGDRNLVWTEMKQEGAVYSYTISHSVAMNYLGWQEELPVVMCLIDIDGGARMYAQLTDVAEQDIHVGMRVKAYFEPIGEEAGIPKFRPV
ncbi:Zn-ribbon domain-containing OB-fold protein [Hoeflea sp. WL0058]|uniref:Zn-ribbon domain-containing OB-fold protein n=1 Tax=Flavimaribacter sediminis TaxID=2865987 RepID=A0AAE3D1N5_9HYPH|nr:Zn-ribbon domain-containing OB-fold protein [Flavimaribacter sediminis]MBW8639069.1 Zn-ribbon domain-containing OB-fold protein [Flavimaribacter sediminis]